MLSQKYLLWVKIHFSAEFCKAGARAAASPEFTGRRERAGRFCGAFMAFWGCLEHPRHSCTFYYPVPAGIVGFCFAFGRVPGGEISLFTVYVYYGLVLAADENPRLGLHPSKMPDSSSQSGDESKSHLFRNSGVLGTQPRAAPAEAARVLIRVSERAIPASISAREIPARCSF